MSVSKQFFKYVSQNVLGMLGLSVYILADTFFISMAEGANGITALNLVLPVYSFIFAIGAMIGVGSAIRFQIAKARQEKSVNDFFANAMIWSGVFGAIFIFLGLVFPGQIVGLLGGDSEIIDVGTRYTRTFMVFAPFFMWNHIMNAFVRNDGDPSLAMVATVTSSMFNIVFDYILMFPFKLGMVGAALATGFSPVVGIAICCMHFLKKEENHIHFKWCLPSLKRLIQACELGVSAFVGEISSGVTTIVFNMLILQLSGNIGVAAYGVVANSALVAVAIFNGVSQGSQPLFSTFYGQGKTKEVKKVLRMGMMTAFIFAIIIYGTVYYFAQDIVAVFNRDQSIEMAGYARTGLHLYFLGFFAAGFNIVGTGYFSATEKAKSALVTSVLRGFVAIIISAMVLARLFGMNGVWLAFGTAEIITLLFMVIECSRSLRSIAYLDSNS